MAEYIDRGTVLEILCGKGAAWDAYSKVQSIPAADVRPITRGKWLDKWCEDNEIISGGFWIKECSNCHEDMYYGEPYFCPNCGADMREES